MTVLASVDEHSLYWVSYHEWERGVWRPRAVAAEKPAVENTPPVAPQASSADPSGTYEGRRGLGGRPGGRPRGAVGRLGARVAHTHWGLWLLGRPELGWVQCTESIAGWPNSQSFRFLEPVRQGTETFGGPRSKRLSALPLLQAGRRHL